MNTTLSYDRIIRLALVAFCLALFFTASPEAFAQGFSANSALSSPQTSSGLIQGTEETMRWIFYFLKFLALCAVAYGSYLMYKGDISSGVWAYLACVGLFFAPALVNLAQKIGVLASQ